MSAHHGPPFLALLFESPAIKSWKDEEGPKLRRALVSAIDAIRGPQPVVVDLLLEFDAAPMEARLAPRPGVHWRHRPSTSLGARVRRRLGIYSGESSLAAAVPVASGEELDALLAGTTLWDAEFTIYPPTRTPLSELPDPHFEIPGFAAAAEWTLSQDAGDDSWLVTARGQQALDMVCATLLQAFQQQALTARTALAPPEVYGPPGT